MSLKHGLSSRGIAILLVALNVPSEQRAGAHAFVIPTTWPWNRASLPQCVYHSATAPRLLHAHRIQRPLVYTSKSARTESYHPGEADTSCSQQSSQCWEQREQIRRAAATDLIRALSDKKQSDDGLILHHLPHPEPSPKAATALDAIQARCRHLHNLHQTQTHNSKEHGAWQRVQEASLVKPTSSDETHTRVPAYDERNKSLEDSTHDSRHELLLPTQVLGKRVHVPACGKCQLSGGGEAFLLSCCDLEEYLIELFQSVARECTRVGVPVALSKVPG
jgi:hypothetical protein